MVPLATIEERHDASRIEQDRLHDRPNPCRRRLFEARSVSVEANFPTPTIRWRRDSGPSSASRRSPRRRSSDSLKPVLRRSRVSKSRVSGSSRDCTMRPMEVSYDAFAGMTSGPQAPPAASPAQGGGEVHVGIDPSSSPGSGVGEEGGEAAWPWVSDRHQRSAPRSLGVKSRPTGSVSCAVVPQFPPFHLTEAARPRAASEPATTRHLLCHPVRQPDSRQRRVRRPGR